MKYKQIYKRNRSSITASLIAGGLLLSLSTLPAFAAVFTVNSSEDLVDNNIADDVCDAGGGVCTLRAAIMQANALAGADTITVPADEYVLTRYDVDESCCASVGDPNTPVVTSDASIGDLDITDDVTIIGAGSESTIIKWVNPPTSPNDDDPLTGDRIFHVAIPVTDPVATENINSVVIQGLTVVNGEVGLEPTTAADVCIDDGIDDGLGATVYTPANLNAYDIFDYNATDANCGTIGDDGKLVGGTIKIDQFRRMGGGIALGGGYAVATYDESKEGTAPVVDPGGEGGAEIEYVTLNDVVVINNWSGADGGGIHNIVPATISQSKISGNTSAGGNGGGVYNEANLIISDTLIGRVFDADTAAAHPELTNPNVGENGGGIFFTGAPQTSTTIDGSAINGNEAIGGAGIAGRVAAFNIANTTISKNIARDIGAGILTAGPAILQNVTVADNVANTTSSNEGGAGLNSFAGGSYTMRHTLLSNNKVEVADAPDKSRLANCGCAGGTSCKPGLLKTLGYNLEDGDTCEFDTTFKFDQINTDPLLVALANNGGLTETHALTHSAVTGAVDSPAVDMGGVNCLNNDQRGSIRPADGNGDGVKDCDIGAFELFEITADLQIANMQAPDTLVVGNNYTVTVTIANGAVDTDTSVKLVTDTLPSIVTFVSATATGGSDNTCAEASGVVTCTIGDLGGTSSATVTLTLTGSAAGDATVTASVTSTGEPDASVDPNNSASVLTRITAVPSGDSDGGGGFCSYQPNGRFDPVLPALVLIGLIYLARKRRV